MFPLVVFSEPAVVTRSQLVQRLHEGLIYISDLITQENYSEDIAWIGDELFPEEIILRTTRQHISFGNEWIYPLIEEYSAQEVALERKTILKQIERTLQLMRDEINAEVSSNNKEAALTIQKIIEHGGFSLSTQPSPRQRVLRLLKKYFGSVVDTFTELIKKILGAIENFFRNIMAIFSHPERISEESSITKILRWLLVMVVVGIVGAVVFLSIRFKWYQGRSGHKQSSGRTDFPVANVRLHNWQRAQECAQRAYVNKDFKLALHYLYLSLLLLFDQNKVIKYQETKTNGEYMKKLRVYPALYEKFRSFTYAFEKSWYGPKSIDENVYRDFYEKYLAFLELQQR